MARVQRLPRKGVLPSSGWGFLGTHLTAQQGLRGAVCFPSLALPQRLVLTRHAGYSCALCPAGHPRSAGCDASDPAPLSPAPPPFTSKLPQSLYFHSVSLLHFLLDSLSEGSLLHTLIVVKHQARSVFFYVFWALCLLSATFPLLNRAVT